MISGGWEVDQVKGSADALHQKSAALLAGMATGSASGRMVRVLQAETATVVLGSGQPADVVAQEAVAGRGWSVVRRNSGGGVVVVGPGEVVWVDVVLPAGDPLWDDDIGRAAWWLGDAWAAALDAAGLGPAWVWRGRMVRSDWSSELCFAGLGPGEVSVGDRKVVGISQRRTRAAALLQTAALLTWRPSGLLDVLTRGRSLDPASRAAAVDQLSAAAAGLGAAHAGALVDALLAALRTA